MAAASHRHRAVEMVLHHLRRAAAALGPPFGIAALARLELKLFRRLGGGFALRELAMCSRVGQGLLPPDYDRVQFALTVPVEVLLPSRRWAALLHLIKLHPCSRSVVGQGHSMRVGNAEEPGPSSGAPLPPLP